MKMKTIHKSLILASSTAAIVSLASILNAQDEGEVDRPAFYSNKVRLTQPTFGAVDPQPEPSTQNYSATTKSETTEITFIESDRVRYHDDPLDPSLADDGLPAIDVEVGECYAQVLVQAEMVPVTEQIMVKEASYELVEVPAEFTEVEERVEVKAGYERQEIIPATYKTVEEKVLVRPAYTRKVPVPPVYETITEKVMVKPERVYWTEGEDPITDLENPMSDIMCLVREPAEYEEVTRRVLVTAGSFREETVPAVYETYTRTVIDEPARIETIVVPAEYETRMVRKVTQPARTERRLIPAQYATVERMEAVGESRIEWQQVLCETNATPELVASIETQLNVHGYDIEIDGELDRETRRAIREFQKEHDLPLPGVTYASLDALGVNY
ncbi:MAG: hypothetical protein SynsKO_04240 [Synoicihabitans sp.]